MVDCPTRDKLGKGLFTEVGEQVKVFEGELDDPVYDTGDLEEEIVQGNVGQLLVVRQSYLTPRTDSDEWLRHNIFHSTCTIGGKVCRMVIKSGSYENVISIEVV